MDGIESRIKEIIAQKFGVAPSEIKSEASLTNDLGLDSLDCVELVMEMEKAFNMEIPDADAEKLSTVSDLVSYVTARAK